MDRLKEFTNAMNKVWQFEYNANDWLTAVIDQNSHSNRFGYDAGGRLTSWTNGLQQVVNYQYNAVYALTNLVDARNNALGFTYQDCCSSRLTSIRYGTGDLEQFVYDGAGNLTNYVNRAGQSVVYAYDAADRLTNALYSGAADVFSYAYDAASQLTNAAWMQGANTNSVLRLAYDNLGRLTNETQAVGTAAPLTVGYQYFDDGRLQRLTYPDGTFVILQYNAKGWLTNVADGATSNTIVNYQYNAAGYRTYRGLGNGAHTRYAYDAAGRLTSLTNYHSSGTAISGFNYGYDNAGNRKWVQRLGGLGDVYTYDAADQVTNVLYDATTPDGTPGTGTNRVGYAIDAAGNWTARVRIYPTLGVTNTTTYIASPLNQYTNVNGAKQWYDAKGNYYSDGTNSYYYDYQNRMYQSYFPGTGITYSNVYDVVGRWVGRKRSAVWNRYYYAGWQLIDERNNAGALQAKYVYGAGLDEPVRMYRSSTYYYYLSDGLGNVTEVLDASGNVVEKYTYDIYGAPTIRNSAGTVLSATAIGNRWLFTGRDWDAEQQAYNYRYRWYSPSLGRFLQTDPIRRGADDNLYRYVYNAPINLTDAKGLDPAFAPGIGMFSGLTASQQVAAAEKAAPFVAGVAVGAGVAVITVEAAPLAVSALTTAGMSSTAAGATVTGGLGVMGIAGGLSSGFNLYYNVSENNWQAASFELGALAGGGYVGYLGGGRALSGLSGKPSSVPEGAGLFGDSHLHYDPKYPGGNWLGWLASAPTPQSGGALLMFGAGGAGVLLQKTCP